ncbi:PA0069 family radical SAM protein [Rhizomicrobium electricum]|uniref:PA0069 family radical SAM protein n=1 Tax=Rhizomicrobium electricum TaxID=480070 RepID=UPI001421C2F6|nr:PA0069 family radical SAM protein [Rhizomicrobium electricum]
MTKVVAKRTVDPGDITADPRRLRGRGAVSNAAGRYERFLRVVVDDGWEHPTTPAGNDPADDDALPPVKTEITVDATRTIITRNKSPDISFDRSINPYRGCEHGCIYCFARPTHAYLGMSPGADFESRLFVKPNAAELLAKELSAPGYTPRTIAIGTNTDPYQPIERQMKIMRSVLEVLRDFRHPVGIVTKSALVTRDIDILAEMAAMGLARVALSVTTLDRKLARQMEPRASTPPKRLEAIRALSQAGIPTSVMFAPIIPALNDGEMESVLAAAKDAGARSAGYVLLRLPLEIKDLFREWLETNRPDAAKHVISLIRQMRGGKDYDAEWTQRQRGTGPYALMLAHRFRMATRRYGLHQHTELRTDLFQRPPKAGDQLRLF